MEIPLKNISQIYEVFLYLIYNILFMNVLLFSDGQLTQMANPFNSYSMYCIMNYFTLFLHDNICYKRCTKITLTIKYHISPLIICRLVLLL